MNRVDVLDKISPLVAGQVRHVRDTDGARVIVEGSRVSLRPSRGARVIDMEPDGAKSMVSFVGMPIKMAKELSGNTFSQVLSELLAHVGQYSIIVKDDRLVNIVPYGAQTSIDPERLLTTIEKAVHVRNYYGVRITKPANVSLDIVGEKTEAVSRGDLVRVGVKVDFSPMGLIRPSVQSFAEVLACTNGAVSSVVMDEYRGRSGGGGGGEGDDIWQWFRESVRKCFESFGDVVGQWRNLQQEKIGSAERARILAALLKKANITGDVAGSVMAMAVEHPPRNSWDMHNLITYASTHLLESPRQITAARTVAANYADEKEHDAMCPMCHR